MEGVLQMFKNIAVAGVDFSLSGNGGPNCINVNFCIMKEWALRHKFKMWL